MEVVGVTLGWDGKPTLMLKTNDGNLGILPRDAESLLNKEYYIQGDWPVDPETGETLPKFDCDGLPKLDEDRPKIMDYVGILDNKPMSEDRRKMAKENVHKLRLMAKDWIKGGGKIIIPRTNRI